MSCVKLAIPSSLHHDMYMQDYQGALKLDFELGVIWLNERLLVIEVFVPVGLASAH